MIWLAWLVRKVRHVCDGRVRQQARAGDGCRDGTRRRKCAVEVVVHEATNVAPHPVPQSRLNGVLGRQATLTSKGFKPAHSPFRNIDERVDHSKDVGLFIDSCLSEEICRVIQVVDRVA